MRERGADVLDAEPLHEQLRQLEDVGRAAAAARRAVGVELAHVPTHDDDGDDDGLVAARRRSTKRRRERGRVVAVAAVHVHLAAARLLGGEDDLVPEPLEHLDRRAADLGEDRVADAGDEEGDAHSCHFRTVLVRALDRRRAALARERARRGPRRETPRPDRARRRPARRSRASSGRTSVSNASSRIRCAPSTSPSRCAAASRASSTSSAFA